MTALLHFRQVPAIHFCHGAINWLEEPLIFPRILRYVVVDHACRDRLLSRGISDNRTRLLLNPVNLERFKQRETSLPPSPRRALVFSNYANEDTYVPAVREACRRRDIELDVIGKGSNNISAHPEKILGNYDIIFAKARCALEGMATGAAVVLCDATGVGPMVTSADFERLRLLNFGFRTLTRPLTSEIISDEIARYNPIDATAVSKLVRATAGHETIVDELVLLYEDVIAEYRLNGTDPEEEGRAAAAYLRQLKIDFAIHGAASMRLRERIKNVPLVGRLTVSLINSLTTKNRPQLKKPSNQIENHAKSKRD
jgi:hypothetical protein